MQYTLHYFAARGGKAISKTQVDSEKPFEHFVAQVRGWQAADGSGSLPGIAGTHDGPILCEFYRERVLILPLAVKPRAAAPEIPLPAKKPGVKVDVSKTTTDSDVEEALEIVAEIEDLAENVPSAGAEFADSVLTRTKDIASTIDRTDRVSIGQLEALRNMRDGLSRWNR